MLSTRGRKDVDAADVKVKVIVEAFDILYLNGKVTDTRGSDGMRAIDLGLHHVVHKADRQAGVEILL